MKKNLIYLCMLVFAMGNFISCSDDDDAKDDLVGTWNLKSGDPMDMTWDSSEKIEIAIGGVSQSMSAPAVAELAKMYANALLPGKLKSITFKDNNNLEATIYTDGNTGNTTVYGTYKVVSGSKINFFPDVDKLLAGVEGLDNTTLLGIKALAVKGLPIHYTLIGNNMNDARFYLNTGTIKEMKPLFALLAATMSGDDAQTAMIKSIIEKLPAVLDNTDKIEVGLNFDKAAN